MCQVLGISITYTQWPVIRTLCHALPPMPQLNVESTFALRVTQCKARVQREDKGNEETWYC